MELDINIQEVRSDFLKILRFIPRFILKPVENMRDLPKFHPLSVLILQATLSAICGLIMGLLSLSWLIIFGPVTMIFSGIVLLTLAGLIIYYFFYFFHAIHPNPLQLLGVLVFSNIPYLIFHAASPKIPPIDLVGLGLSGLLLIVGLTDHMKLPRKHSVRLVATLCGLASILILWSWIWSGWS